MTSTKVSERPRRPVPTPGFAGVEAERSARRNQHVIEVLPIGLGQRVGYGRDPIEPRTRGLDFLRPIQEHRDCGLPVSGQQQRGRSGKLLGRKAQSCDQRTPPQLAERASLLHSIVPVATRRNAVLKLLHREETPVPEAWNRRIQLREKLVEEPNGCVPAIGFQSLPTDSLDLLRR